MSKTMRLGYTGTQNGMNSFQKAEFILLLNRYMPTAFHHGDCIGADAQAHFLFLDWHCEHDTISRRIVVHTPVLKGKIAWCGVVAKYPVGMAAKLLACANPVIILNCEPKPYLERNKDIVDESDVMIACPKEVEHTLRSGTWATIRYSWKQKKETIVIPPIFSDPNYEESK